MNKSPSRSLLSSSSPYQPSPLSNTLSASNPPASNKKSLNVNNTAPETFLDGQPLPRVIVFDLDYTLWPFWVDTHVTMPLKAKESNTRVQDRWGESFSFYPGVPNVLYAARESGILLSVASRTPTPDIAKSMLKNLVVTPPFNPIAGAATGDVGGDPSTATTTTATTTATTTSSGKASGVAAAMVGGLKQKLEKPSSLKAVDYFQHAQIYPGSKLTHFRRIQDAFRKAGDPVAFEDMLFFDDEARNRNVETELGVTFWLVRDGVSKDEVDRAVREWRKRRAC